MSIEHNLRFLILYIMKIDYINNYEYTIYLNKYYYTFDKDTIEKCIFKVLKRLKKEYNIDIYSTFNIKCYINDYYGIILNIIKETDPFLKYKEKTNTNIKYYEKSIFLFEIDDYFLKNKLKCKVYMYNKKHYIELMDDYFNICEHINNIVFGDKILKIINNDN